MEKILTKYLSRDEAAAYLRISLRKLDQLAAEGEIPYSKMGNGKRARVIYKSEDLDNYVNKNTCRYQCTSQ